MGEVLAYMGSTLTRKVHLPMLMPDEKNSSLIGGVRGFSLPY